MKLSDAIRLGAMLKPQGFGQMATRFGRTCALGAAREAGFPIIEDRQNGHAVEECPDVMPCPVCRMRLGFYGTVTHLNDQHRWTREAIADWVETVELADQSTGEPERGLRVDPVVPVALSGSQRDHKSSSS